MNQAKIDNKKTVYLADDQQDFLGITLEGKEKLEVNTSATMNDH